MTYPAHECMWCLSTVSFLVRFSLLEDEYEKEIRQLISEAEPIKASDFRIPPIGEGTCEVDVEGTNKTYAFFFRMNAWEDTELYKTIAKVSKLLRCPEVLRRNCPSPPLDGVRFSPSLLLIYGTNRRSETHRIGFENSHRFSPFQMFNLST